MNSVHQQQGATKKKQYEKIDKQKNKTQAKNKMKTQKPIQRKVYTVHSVRTTYRPFKSYITQCSYTNTLIQTHRYTVHIHND